MPACNLGRCKRSLDHCEPIQPWSSNLEFISFKYSPKAGQINASRLYSQGHGIDKWMTTPHVRPPILAHTHTHTYSTHWRWDVVKHEVQSRSHIHSRKHIAHVYLTLLRLTHVHSGSREGASRSHSCKDITHICFIWQCIMSVIMSLEVWCVGKIHFLSFTPTHSHAHTGQVLSAVL